jgi:hypothetical protein
MGVVEPPTPWLRHWMIASLCQHIQFYLTDPKILLQKKDYVQFVNLTVDPSACFMQ